MAYCTTKLTRPLSNLVRRRKTRRAEFAESSQPPTKTYGRVVTSGTTAWIWPQKKRLPEDGRRSGVPRPLVDNMERAVSGGLKDQAPGRIPVLRLKGRTLPSAPCWIDAA